MIDLENAEFWLGIERRVAMPGYKRIREIPMPLAKDNLILYIDHRADGMVNPIQITILTFHVRRKFRIWLEFLDDDTPLNSFPYETRYNRPTIGGKSGYRIIPKVSNHRMELYGKTDMEEVESLLAMARLTLS